MTTHTEKLKRVVNSVQENLRKKQHVRIYHGHTNSTREYKRTKDTSIDISDFTEILEFNEKKSYIVAQANVTMGKLVDYCLERGYIPKVVPEFPNITVGGAIQGGAGESSSFKFGLFHEICTEYEIVLGSGKVEIASPSINKDLYHMLPCTLGSLAIITSAKIEIIPAKTYIKATYHRIVNLEGLSKQINETCKRTYDFVDGIMNSPSEGVIITGEMVEKAQSNIQTFSRKSDNWYGLHVAQIIKESKKETPYIEYIPIKDYLFRYDRGSFWMGKYAFDLLQIPFNQFFRTILDKVFHTSELYRYLQATNVSQKFLVQDISLPIENLESFLQKVITEFSIFPLWICPLKKSKTPYSPSNLDTDLVVNIGIWGNQYKSYEDFVNANRRLESLTQKSKGRKVLYAHCYYTIDEYKAIYPVKELEELRRNNSSDIVFTDMYEKIKVKGKYKVNLPLGILKTFFKV